METKPLNCRKCNEKPICLTDRRNIAFRYVCSDCDQLWPNEGQEADRIYNGTTPWFDNIDEAIKAWNDENSPSKTKNFIEQLIASREPVGGEYNRKYFELKSGEKKSPYDYAPEGLRSETDKEYRERLKKLLGIKHLEWEDYTP